MKIKNGQKSPAIFETLHIVMANWLSSSLTTSLSKSSSFFSHSLLIVDSKVPPERFYWNGNNTDFRPQI